MKPNINSFRGLKTLKKGQTALFSEKRKKRSPNIKKSLF